MKFVVNNFDLESAVLSPDAVVSLGVGHSGKLHSMSRSDNARQLEVAVAVKFVAVVDEEPAGLTLPVQPIE